ncbi:hypothetical protein VPNG_02345 [Cytospora leucostoma]|uniref:ABC1 atypical kinase-like domain-containing protein n=1 Tax=Cytospora leucostoma TaxID=1230097 RepID=A0A423XGM2_9PEZI|nr:hypothetical protein VPNG_02345 [Cytospora leucostoma]
MGLVNFAIDLAAVLSASRSVASRHVALRTRQVEYYGKTSSIAAALRGRQQQQYRGQDAAANAAQKKPASSGTDEVYSATSPGSSDVIKAPSHEVSTSLSQDAERGIEAHQPEATNTGVTDPTTSPPTAQGLGLQKEKSEKTQVVQPVEGQTEADSEPIPEGIILDGLFHTKRGAKLGAKWKGTKPSERPKKPLPGAVDFGHASSNPRESSILKELNKSSDTFSPSTPKVEKKPAVEDLPTSTQAVDELSPELVAEAQAAARNTGKATSIADGQNQTGSSGVSREEASAIGETLGVAATTPAYELRESRVPSSRLGRIWNYSGLAAGMFAGTVSESFSRVMGGGGEGSLMLSPANMERLVAKLSKMRGAALKLGQMMSFQDSKMLPAPIQEVLQRVQDRADYMPGWQRDRVLATNLGSEWRDLFVDFEEKPIAAASIGQVHRATLKSNGAKVAVKIQFPGVADSINSDLDNLGVLLAATKLLPKGLYLNKTIDNARTELGWECDYEREAQCAQRYKDLLAAEDDVFLVPQIYPEASGKQVLTMEFMDGVGVTRIKSFTQEQRDWIGTQILRLCLREITEFRFMQTDPNWTNFLYDASRDRLVLLDFGASREYPDHFIGLYVQLLAAASRADRGAVKDLSERLGYLTGHESRAMLDAHIASVVTLAEPFLASAPEVYDFRDQTITERVKEQIPVMIKERLAPPPEETYSLHRKLSGAFLLCARMGSRVRCRELFEDAVVKSRVLAKQV